jgi:cell division protein FtsQ
MTHARFKKTKPRPSHTPQKRAARRQSREPFFFIWARRCRPWLPYLLLILVLAVGYKMWLMLQDPILFPLKRVEVQAQYTHISKARLRAAMSGALQGGFFSLDINQFKARVLQALPWAASISVRRVWPSRIKVIVKERQAMAVWNGSSLLTAKGLLFMPAVSTFPKNLVQLEGPSDALGVVLGEYLQVRDVLEPVHLSVKKLEMTDRQAWHCWLNNGMRLMLGRQDMGARLGRFVNTYTQVVGEKADQVVSVDLRYPNGYAVKWKGAV